MLNHELVPLDLGHSLDARRRPAAAPDGVAETSAGRPPEAPQGAPEGAPTWRELNRRADLLFRHLHRSGVLPGPLF
jgi:non-ribosomal peptide synthetase component F